MKKFLALLLVLSMMVSMVACVSPESEQVAEEVEAPAEEAAADTETPAEEAEEAAEEAYEADLSENVELKINFVMGNTQRTMTYNQADPLTLPDGSVVTSGDLKPVWQEISNNANITIQDVAVQDQKGSEMIDLAAASNFAGADIFGGNGISQKLMNYGTEGYFVNLADYLDQMPNFAQYLEDNGSVKSAISSKEGDIYYVPYISEIGNYARAYMCREDWVIALLDGADMEAETATLDVAYDAYWTDDLARNNSNVVELQNAAAVNGTLDGTTAITVLVDYINETYDYENPSELFLGVDAQYDIDELVALLRAVKLSPNTLSKEATGEVVDEAIITPLFWRKSSYRQDALRLASFFGGQRVYGSDSYEAKLYADENDELQFSYAEDGVMETVDKLKDMYSEGLINIEFTDEANKTNFRSELLAQDDVDGQYQFGFYTSDWFASTSAASDEMIGILPPVSTTPVSDGEFIHFLENTRTIKSDGWAISATLEGDKLDRALYLFDYIFSEEGAQLQNYGLANMVEENETYTGPDGIEYPKFNDWVFETAGEVKDGDVSAFLRDFVGSHLAIGYPKEIGFEYQYTAENGLDAWGLYSDAGVLSPSYTSEEPYYKLVPPVFPLDSRDIAKIGNTAIGDTQVDLIFQYIIGAEGAVASTEELQQNYIDSGLELYLEVYRDVYDSIK